MNPSSEHNLSKSLGFEAAGQGGEDNVVNFEVHPQAADASAADLEALQGQLLQHLLPHIDGYIWQRDRFNLRSILQRRAPWQHAAARESGGGAAAKFDSQPPQLWGSVNFGDNIEDEWFIVWLLMDLTRAFPVSARVWDNDGEFVLIEAAYSLPRWLKPETARNRVWLHGGDLHIVPLPWVAGDASLPAAPTAAEALALVRGSAVDTLAPARAVQQALAGRLGGFPGHARELLHRATALLPARVAHILHREPQLVAAAVEAFHYRDPSDVRSAARMAAFPPANMLPASVVFSRCLYAQVALQQYTPPKGWPQLPLPSDPGFGAAELGAKLTAGFEMMYANQGRYGADGSAANAAAGRSTTGGAEASEGAPTAAGGCSAPDMSAAARQQDRDWQAYLARLQALGYFGDELPGSAAYKAALQRAMADYRRSEGNQAATEALAEPAQRVLQLLQEPLDVAALSAAAAAVPAADGEAWLREGSAKLEAELQLREKEFEAYQQRRAGKIGHAAGAGNGAAAATAALTAAAAQGRSRVGPEFDPTVLSARLREFMEAASGLEGIEVPAEGVAFDEERFAAELQRVLGMVAVPSGGGARHCLEGSEEDGVSSHTSEEGSSFFSGSDTGDKSDDWTQPAGGGGKMPSRAEWQSLAGGGGRDEELWETRTATDSDDDAAFMEGYSRALDQQLGGTSMAQTFEQAEDVVTKPGSAAAAASGAAEGDPGSEEEGGALCPVDVDVNLVSSLLASYREQGGLPGPAGNLAGLLGVTLPDPGAL